MALPVVLYVPNVLCYLRIILAYAGFFYSTTDPVLTVWIWIVSAFLDLFDGILARKLNQCSSLGILLDIAADNILRSNIWVAAAVRDEKYRFVAAFFM
jgi:phosphatidylglycerophosphate synthase